MRNAEIKRKTGETDIVLSLELDGTGTSDIQTGCADNLCKNLAVRDLLAVSVINENTLADSNYHSSLARESRLLYLFDNELLVKRNLGNANCNRTCCNTCHKSDITAVTSHNLNDVTTSVGLAGVA